MVTTSDGLNVVGKRASCDYQGSKDPAPVHIEGTIISQREIAGKGDLLTFKTANGIRPVYFHKATNFKVYVAPRVVRNTDDGYDAWKDGQLELYGDLPRNKDGTVRRPRY
jgi:hypothetical protein